MLCVRPPGGYASSASLAAQRERNVRVPPDAALGPASAQACRVAARRIARVASQPVVAPNPRVERMPAQQSTEAERGLVETARRVLPGGGFGNVSHEVVIARGLAG